MAHTVQRQLVVCTVLLAFWLAPRAARSQTAPPVPASPTVGPPRIPPRSPLYPALGATALGIDLGSATWLATGALSSRDLKSAMLKPLPIGLALGAGAVGAATGALVVTDGRRLLRLGIPIGGGVMLGSMVALFGGGGWYLTCNEPAGPDRDACHRRAARFFAGSLAVGTALGGVTGLVLALTVPPRSATDPVGVSVLAGPGSLLLQIRTE
jgi:hypothetical protein